MGIQLGTFKNPKMALLRILKCFKILTSYKPESLSLPGKNAICDCPKVNKCKTVYELSDQLQMFTSINATVRNNTKLTFHSFRVKVYRTR